MRWTRYLKTIFRDTDFKQEIITQRLMTESILSGRVRITRTFPICVWILWLVKSSSSITIPQKLAIRWKVSPCQVCKGTPAMLSHTTLPGRACSCWIDQGDRCESQSPYQLVSSLVSLLRSSVELHSINKRRPPRYLIEQCKKPAFFRKLGSRPSWEKLFTSPMAHLFSQSNSSFLAKQPSSMVFFSKLPTTGQACLSGCKLLLVSLVPRRLLIACAELRLSLLLFWFRWERWDMGHPLNLA